MWHRGQAVPQKQVSWQVSKETFHKWQWTYEREHQSMAWLCAEMDQDESLVSMLWCIVFRQYKTRICGLKNLSVQCISMKCVRPTFSGGRLSYIVIWESSGYYEIVICIPAVTMHSWSLLAVPILVNASYTTTFQGVVYWVSNNRGRQLLIKGGVWENSHVCFPVHVTCDEMSRL